MSDALLARTLLQSERFGVLSSHSQKAPGFPFGSLVAYALTEDGLPMLLTSRLAEHTHNFLADGRVSLCVHATPPQDGSDTLAHGRVTLLGTIESLDKEESSAVYLVRHPEAAGYLSFKDFLMVRIQPESLRYVGGFGAMSWISADDFAVSAFAAGAIAHMNEDHQEALGLLAGGGVARMTAVDARGFDMICEPESPPEGGVQIGRRVRIEFQSVCRTAQALRIEMVRLTRAAREARKA